MKEILVVESGSTKTQWTLVNGVNVEKQIKSNGLNASYMSSEDITDIIQVSLPQSLREKSFDAIYYYGAGCSGEVRIAKMKKALQNCFKRTKEISVKNDLYASAHALLGKNKGLVGILGTGSNICFYDGVEIIQQFTSFGYLLGDEGGGVSLGRRLLKRYLRKELNEELRNKFYSEYKMSDEQLIVELYQSKQPNKWMASFAPFLSEHRKDPEIVMLLSDAFDSFFKSLVEPYKYTGINTLNLTGSIAAVFRPEIEVAALKNGFEIGNVLKEPLDELIEFHVKSSID